MSFLTPVFLAAGAAVVVPLILHLLQRRRTVTLSFSTIRFLKLAQKHSSRRIRLESLLLLILRMLLVAIIVLAFAMPVIRTTGFGAVLGNARRDVAIIIDGSYSMRYDLGNDTAWDRAIRGAQSVVSGLRDGDRVCVFMAADTVEAIIEQPVANRDFVSTRIQSLKPGSTSSRLFPALASALAALSAETSRRETEIHIFSDGQALAWGDDESQPDSDDFPDNTACFVTLTGAEAAKNVTVSHVSLSPEVVMNNIAARLEARLSFSGPMTEGTATVFIGDEEVDRRAFRQGIESVLSFALPALKSGVHAARVETHTDNLRFDDTFYFLIHVHERLPVLCVGADPDLQYLVSALGVGLAGSGAIEIRRAAPGLLLDERLSDYESVFLCNALPLDGQAILQVENYVREGGLTVLFPGDRALPADYQAWACLVPPAGIADAQFRDRGTVLNWSQGLHPLVRTLTSEDGNAPVISIRRRLSWPSIPESARTIISARPDSPFLIENVFGEGKTLQFAVSADRAWSNFPLSPFYLPILHQTVKHGAGIRARQPFRWTSATSVLRESDFNARARLMDPDGEDVVIHETFKDGRSIRIAEDLLTPGIYSSMAEGVNVPAIALNAARRESDLLRVEHGRVKDALSVEPLHIAEDIQSLERLIEDHRVGRSLGEALLWLALLLCVIEVFFANFKAKSVTPLSEVLGAAPSGRIEIHKPAQREPFMNVKRSPAVMLRQLATHLTLRS